MELVNVVKSKFDERLDPRPDGYNVGFNSGDAAGQTVGDWLSVSLTAQIVNDDRDLMITTS